MGADLEQYLDAIAERRKAIAVQETGLHRESWHLSDAAIRLRLGEPLEVVKARLHAHGVSLP